MFWHAAQMAGLGAFMSVLRRFTDEVHAGFIVSASLAEQQGQLPKCTHHSLAARLRFVLAMQRPR